MSDRIHYLQITRGKSYQRQVMETSLKTQLYERDIRPLALTARRARQKVRIYEGDLQAGYNNRVSYWYHHM